MRLKCAFMMAVVAANNSIAATPTETTRAAQQRVLQAYAFADRQDFEDAKRGLIEALPGNVIYDAAGQIVWDLRPFLAFEGEEKPAPDTVNPALWRHAQLNNINGLFEVIPGIVANAQRPAVFDCFGSLNSVPYDENVTVIAKRSFSAPPMISSNSHVVASGGTTLSFTRRSA